MIVDMKQTIHWILLSLVMERKLDSELAAFNQAD